MGGFRGGGCRRNSSGISVRRSAHLPLLLPMMKVLFSVAPLAVPFANSDLRCRFPAATAFAPPPRVQRPLLPAKSSSLLHAGTESSSSNNDDGNNKKSPATSTTTTQKSSTGRLRFCYDRLGMECPDDGYLLGTPAITIADDLREALSSMSAQQQRQQRLPEEACIAVLDAYMVAYRETRKKKFDTALRSTPAYAGGMDAVVNGMVSTVAILRDHDDRLLTADDGAKPNHDDGDGDGDNVDAPDRTVDPYATILHMLLELALDNAPDLELSSRWASRMVALLADLESDPVLTSDPGQTNARLLQHNKVLRALVATGGTGTGVKDAVRLLAAMVAVAGGGETPVSDAPPSSSSAKDRNNNNNNSNNNDNNEENEMDGLLLVMTDNNNSNNGDVTTTRIPVRPDARSFATVLSSAADDLLSERDARRLVGASVTLGVYEGYLQKFLVRTLGADRLSKLLAATETTAAAAAVVPDEGPRQQP